jgi:hypothetical protein
MVIHLPRNHWGWQLRREGRHWRATGPGFVNVIQSPAGFGVTPEAAVRDLRRKRSTSVPVLDRFIVLAPPLLWAGVDGEPAIEEK